MNMNKTKTAPEQEVVAGTGIRDGATLLELARGWLKQGNAIVALELLNSAVTSREVDSDLVLQAQILKEIGRAKMMQSDWEAAESHYLQAQRLFKDTDHFKGASECARNRANLNFQKGNFREAEALCEQALEWASVAGESELRATILNTLGAIQSATGNHAEAIKTLGLCLADFRTARNRSRQGYVLLNIGLAQLELADHTQAIAHFNESLAIAMETQDLTLVEICYQNIARCYLIQKQAVLARSVIDTARKILPGLSSIALEAELNVIDCRILHLAGDLKRAEALLDKTHVLAVEHKLCSIEADIVYEQGLVENDKGNTARAMSKLDAAANLYQRLGMDKGFKDAIRALDNLRKKHSHG